MTFHKADVCPQSLRTTFVEMSYSAISVFRKPTAKHVPEMARHDGRIWKWQMAVIATVLQVRVQYLYQLYCKFTLFKSSI
jgi:hypothetical protein